MSVARFPYGLSLLYPGALVRGASANTLSASAVPSVKNGSFFYTAKSSLTITNFTSGNLGQIICIASKSNGATTLQNSAGGIVIYSSVGVNSAGLVTITTGNYLMQANEAKTFIYEGTSWIEMNCGIRIP